MKNLLTLALVLLSTALYSQPFNCFGIIAGSKATADGSVIMAHNEDDGGEQMLNIYAAPAAGGNARYLWFEFPGSSVADAFMNEHGVCVASDACSSREDKPQLTDGGVLYQIRVTVGKKARSARHAVSLIGELVEKYGYSGSGRTYLAADPKEGWIISIVKGKHWVAQRVPDDCVMTIPNYYVIEDVNLDDKENFAGSADIVEYAVSRGWYDPAKDGKFSFRKAYAAPNTLVSDHNVIRHDNAYNFFYGRSKGKREPIALKPLKPVTVETMIDALSLPAICNENTVLSSVFHLRGWLPVDKGCVAWTAMGHPDVNVFIPWYMGITAVPDNFCRYSSPEKAEANHFSDSKDMRRNYPDHFYWKYADSWKNLKKRNARQQRKAFRAAAKFEKSGSADYNGFISGMYD